MLGCHDFNGYYEWTFHYLRRRFGEDAVQQYWEEAVAADSQQHYIRSGRDHGLQGLYRAWAKSGTDEQCDWTITLTEEQDLLRLDMRNCPSKGFLLKRDLNADEDYCDHCMGWIGPALVQIGAEVSAHEHNHCGQCWWEMRLKGRASEKKEFASDIRNDPRWGQGYLHRYAHHTKQPIVEWDVVVDSCDLLRKWFAAVGRIVVVGPDTTVKREGLSYPSDEAMITIGHRYAAGDVPIDRCRGVLLEADTDSLAAVAKRYHATSTDLRPLLMYTYLPKAHEANFIAADLPRPIPVLPMLIRSACYVHQPGQPYPSPFVFAMMLALALEKRTALVGVRADSQPPRSGGDDLALGTVSSSAAQQLDLDWLKLLWRERPNQLELPAELLRLAQERSS